MHYAIDTVTGTAIYTTDGPLWFLTNGLCESTDYWNPEILRFYYEKCSDEYPLSDEEKNYITAMELEVTDEYFLNMGYTVWWKNKKYFAPTLEIVPSLYRSAQSQYISKIVRYLDGDVIFDKRGLLGRFCIHILVPCSTVLRHFSLEQWNTFLKSLFVSETMYVYIDENCDQEHGGNSNLANSNGKSYGCSVYNIQNAPYDEEEFSRWLHLQNPLFTEWSASEEAAIYNANYECEKKGYMVLKGRRYV
jgi:hypothetical protein